MGLRLTGPRTEDKARSTKEMRNEQGIGETGQRTSDDERGRAARDILRTVQTRTGADGVPEGFDAEVVAGLRRMQKPGQPDVIAELLDILLSLLPVQLAEMRKAVAEGQAETLRRAAHRLRGSSAGLGAKSIAAVCEKLEDQGQRGSLKGAPDLLRELEIEARRIGSTGASGSF